MEAVFSASFLLVLPFWFLMIFLPTWRWTERIVRSPWIAAPAALLYAALVLPRLLEVLGVVANPNLAGVSALLGSPRGRRLAGRIFSPSTSSWRGGPISTAGSGASTSSSWLPCCSLS